MWKTILSPSLRSFIERQIERLESLEQYIPEAKQEVESLKDAYLLDRLESLAEYAASYGFFESPKIKKKEEKSFFLVEPIRKQGKISLDSYGIRCLAYYRQGTSWKFEIQEKVFNLAELKRFARCQVFDAEDYNEAKKLFELLEWKQGER